MERQGNLVLELLQPQLAQRKNYPWHVEIFFTLSTFLHFTLWYPILLCARTQLSFPERSSRCDTLPEWGRSKISKGHWPPHLIYTAGVSARWWSMSIGSFTSASFWQSVYNDVQQVILKKSCFIQELISMTRHDGKPADLVPTGPYERSRYHNSVTTTAPFNMWQKCPCDI